MVDEPETLGEFCRALGFVVGQISAPPISGYLQARGATEADLEALFLAGRKIAECFYRGPLK
jgi:hypothetical protein